MDRDKPSAGVISVARYLPQRIKPLIEAMRPEIRQSVQEIRLRAARPITLRLDGQVREQILEGSPVINRQEVEEAFQSVCRFSVHSFARELSQGFITLPGGHRVGLCGTAVTKDGTLETIKYVSCMNFRIARERKGAADSIISLIKREGAGSLLLAGPPASGKTTVLRDLCRQLSVGEGCTVSVVDERGELGAVWQGVPGRDLGLFTDILDGYGKAEGIELALRTLAPQYIAVDEIGGEDDCKALEQAMCAGVKLLATAHAGSLSELSARPGIRSLLMQGAFQWAVLLGTGNRVGQVLDKGRWSLGDGRGGSIQNV